MSKDKQEKNINIIYVLNILKKYSDSEHILSSNKIAALIKEEYDVDIDPRSVRRYINLLTQKFDYDIETYNDNHKGCFLRTDPDSEFEDGELSVILNTFAYSNFIPEKMADQIIKKCLNMMNIYEKDKYKEYKACIKNTRTNNMEIIKNIEDINTAIYNKNKIMFDYYKYVLDDGLKEKFDHKVKTSPYRLVYALQKFYLICLDDDKKKLYNYRLDRMKNIRILTARGIRNIDAEKVDDFIKNNVNMLSGILEKVEIECDMSMLGTVVETYGKDITLRKINKDKFYASFDTTIKGFRLWCLRNIETVKVISPETLRENIKQVMKKNS